jgi:hypothetical protein
MAKTWYDHFQYSLSETSRVTGIPLPAPQSIFGTFAAAMATLGAMVNALKVVSPRSAVTIGQLLAAARTVELSALAAATVAEIITVAGAVTASYYIGSLVGAAIYATQQVTVGDWLDRIFDDYFAAQENAKALGRVSKTSGAAPILNGMGMPSEMFRTDKVFEIPAADCSAKVPTYCVGWPVTASLAQ